jgi:hypothetical protein
LNQEEPVIVKDSNGLKIVVGVTFSMIFFKVAFPEFRALKTMQKISNYEPSPKKFTGTPRGLFNTSLYQNFRKKTVLAYAPHRSGLSSGLQSFCSEQNHCLVLNTRGPWAEELNEVGIPVTFSFYDYHLLTIMIRKLMQKYEDMIFILDGVEKLTPNEKKYLSRLVSANNSLAGNFIIAGSDPTALREFSWAVDSQFLSLPEVTLDEMHLILKDKQGYNGQDLESLWNECGSDFEYALEMTEQGKGLNFFLNEKRNQIKEDVEEIMNSEKNREIFLAILGSRNEFRPLGSLYHDSTLVEELKKRKLVKGLDLDSYCFRNKFVLKSIINEVQKLIQQEQS